MAILPGRGSHPLDYATLPGPHIAAVPNYSQFGTVGKINLSPFLSIVDTKHFRAAADSDYFGDVNEMILDAMPVGYLRRYFFPPTLTSTIVIVSLPKMSTTFTAILRRPGVHS